MYLQLLTISLFSLSFQNSELGTLPASYGSLVRLQHKNTEAILYSDDYQLEEHQIVIIMQKNHQNRKKYSQKQLFYLKAEKKQNEERLTIHCGDNLQLSHYESKARLQVSKSFSPVSHNRKVGLSQKSFSGNQIFRVECPKGKPLKGGMSFSLYNKEQGCYLSAQRGKIFRRGDCGHQCPYEGQMEVVCQSRMDQNTQWLLDSGLVFDPQYDDERAEFEYESQEL